MQTHHSRKLIGGLAPVCLAGSLAFSGAALAATSDGTVGPTSTGTLDVTMNVPALALIENLSTIALNWSDTDVTGSAEFCVWSTTGGYNITLDSLNGNGTDFMADSGTGTLTYNVLFDDDLDASDGDAFTDGQNRIGYGTPDDAFPPGCAANNAELQVTFPSAGNLDSAAQGLYVDTVTMTVSPE